MHINLYIIYIHINGTKASLGTSLTLISRASLRKSKKYFGHIIAFLSIIGTITSIVSKLMLYEVNRYV